MIISMDSDVRRETNWAIRRGSSPHRRRALRRAAATTREPVAQAVNPRRQHVPASPSVTSRSPPLQAPTIAPTRPDTQCRTSHHRVARRCPDPSSSGPSQDAARRAKMRAARASSPGFDARRQQHLDRDGSSPDRGLVRWSQRRQYGCLTRKSATAKSTASAPEPTDDDAIFEHARLGERFAPGTTSFAATRRSYSGSSSC